MIDESLGVTALELEGSPEYKATVLAKAIEIVRRDSGTTITQMASSLGLSTKTIHVWRQAKMPIDGYRFRYAR